ncbi:hypothetical protein INS49_010844 [Diaporthe citri]|uniref:uncharacterized protein n=1 Tax=Diaporthe citri TaxID=83186 RepID=UPI001C7F3771|nr:uncharacterized protein INS49_010844 [Diaporthe citri]KAG6359792.1 hypothetical protein INS49_010844 [Diaporthe citri]
MMLASLICLTLGISLASANVEKTIFLGPEAVNIPDQQPSLSSLNIDTLTPEGWSLRTHLEAIFPTEESERGRSSWFLLDNLTEGQRYEVRICWLATQPTAFHLETHTLPAVFDTPELITSLHNYSMSRQDSPHKATTRKGESSGGEHLSSVLLLRIDAAADYFTTDRELMRRPEPVLADVILDPFLLNVLPRTLLPTVGYVVLVAAASWVLATRLLMPWVGGLMVDDSGGDGQQDARRHGEEEKKTR